MKVCEYCESTDIGVFIKSDSVDRCSECHQAGSLYDIEYQDYLDNLDAAEAETWYDTMVLDDET